MTLGEQQEEFSRDVETLLAFAHACGYGVRLGEVQRMPEMQKSYVQDGRSKTMNSYHLKKLAVDLHFTQGGQICYPATIGHFWQALSPENRAGMFWQKFKDSPHFERRV